MNNNIVPVLFITGTAITAVAIATHLKLKNIKLESEIRIEKKITALWSRRYKGAVEKMTPDQLFSEIAESFEDQKFYNITKDF